MHTETVTHQQWEHWNSLPEEHRAEAALNALNTFNTEALYALLEAYIRAEELPEDTDLKPNTRSTHRSGAAQYVTFLRQVGQEQLHPLPDRQHYVNWLTQQGLAPATIRLRSVTAGKMMAALDWAGLQQRRSPSVKHPREKSKPRRAYTDAEIHALLRYADVEETLIVLLGVDAGLKTSEMLGLQGEQVHLDPPQPGIEPAGVGTGKIPLTPALHNALQAWFKGYPQAKTGKVFPRTKRIYLEERIRQLCDRAGVNPSGAGLEGLRSTFGARLYQATKDERLLMQFLRIKEKRNLIPYIQAAALLNTASNGSKP